MTRLRPRHRLCAALAVLLVWILSQPTAAAQSDRDSNRAGLHCRDNTVVVLAPNRSVTNRCAGVRYVVQKAYFERILSGYTSGREAVPLVEEALAERDSVIRLLDRKNAVLDSTRRALMQLSGALSDESVRALTAAQDTLNRAVLPELRAIRDGLDAASDDLRDAERRLFWARLKFAAIPALAGVAVGFVLGR